MDQNWHLVAEPTGYIRIGDYPSKGLEAGRVSCAGQLTPGFFLRFHNGSVQFDGVDELCRSIPLSSLIPLHTNNDKEKGSDHYRNQPQRAPGGIAPHLAIGSTSARPLPQE